MKKYIGERIRKARKKKRLTLEQAAEKIGGTNFSSLGKIERGEYEASYELLEKLSELYDVKISYFFGEEAEVPPEFKELGVEGLVIAKELRDEELTKEEKQNIIQYIKFLKSQRQDN